MFEDLLNNTKWAECLESDLEDVAASVECDSVDIKEAAGVIFSINAGAITWSPDGTDKLGLVLQDSADDSVWADVTDESVVQFKISDTITAMEDATTGLLKMIDAAGDADKLYSAQYVGQKRFARILLEHHGTITTIDIGVTSVVFGLSRAGASGVIGS